jgi:uncharacterized membrane protein YdjX (TVP38/TMEM64 family)
MPRASASPARSRIPATDRVTRGSAKKEGVKVSNGKATPPSATSDSFWASLAIYIACVASLAAALAFVLSRAPPSPAVCTADISPWLLLRPKTENIIKIWRCAMAYQAENWWFVLGLFEITYLGLKSFAIPAAFSLCVLAGAIFPLPLAQACLVIGESVGSSICYLLSRAIARPLLEHFAPAKLSILRAKVAEERAHLFTFNIFMRITPFLPNWFINVASPVVGNPLHLFFAGTFLGTQLGVFFLALGGNTLRVAGESGFDLQVILKKGTVTSLIMIVLQFLPLWVIKKQKAAAAAAAASGAKKKKSA